MVNFAGLQAAVKARLEEDREIQIIDAEGRNVEAALNEASLVLGVPVRNLEYEVVLLKTSFWGIGEDICKIRAFERPNLKKARLEEAENISELEDFGELEIINDRDGAVFVRRLVSGVFIKILPPEGEGKKATIVDVERALRKAGIVENYDNDKVKAAVRKISGEYERIGDYINNIANDTAVSVEVTDNEMCCYITVTPPKLGGCDFTFEDYMDVLKNNTVCYGINEQFLSDFADKPLYRKRVCVATGKKPIDGMDSYLEYYFETDQSKARIVADDKTGRVNLKELNLIQNVTKGQKLARKNDAETGEDGKTVTGKLLPAKAGKDLAIQLGKNVSLGEDGKTIISDISGQVVFSNGKINVEMVYMVEGSVCLKTGNITFLGNVIVTGNVEEGFSVRAAGNIEVYGTVTKAALDAKGEIIVNQGISGKEGITIHAGCNIWAKFIENANIDAGDSVIVTEGIINSTINASKRIICQGKRATIMGGRVAAGDEIFAKQIGSPGGNAETICEVGYDPKTKHKIEQLTAQKETLQAEFDEVQLNLQTLTNIKKQRGGTLPEDKEAYFAELAQKRTETEALLKKIDEEITQLTEALEKMQVQGKITATAKFFPGAVISIRQARDTLRTEFKASTFVLENNLVRAVPYLDKEAKPKK